MARVGRILLFAAFVAVVGAASWLQLTSQRTRADRASTTTASVAAVLDSVVQGENAARDYSAARNDASLDAYTASRAGLTRAIEQARRTITSPGLRARLVDELALVDRWGTRVARDIAAASAGTPSGAAATHAAERGSLVARIHAASGALVRALDRHDRDARNSDGIRGLVLIVAVCVLFTIVNWLLFVRTERRQAQERDRQLAFAERLQSARSEDAARTMLARHLEQVAPESMALVTDPDDRSPAGRPVVSGGERVGTVILRTPRDLSAPTRRLVHDSILRAAPVLATLRSLALAQARAATDPLTGLGNRRLVEDALGRLAAQSRRTGEPFAVAVVDLDRFKLVNDTHGHAAGDALLVAVGGALDAATREYDVVGRHGGDEFIVLLADLDATEAATVMDRCRAAVADIRIGDPPVGVTASIGVVTSLVGDNTDPAALVRAADDAVYAAKARGGDCVITGVPAGMGV
jgi:diguanylate cyclase (GGDEF)-like protein